jgi:hypothetical protein
VFIIDDLMFSWLNRIGRLIHPPFVTAIVASIAAGIGEETMFRLFFISLANRRLGRPGIRRPLPTVTHSSPRVVISCYYPPSRNGMVFPSVIVIVAAIVLALHGLSDVEGSFVA